jgi:multidrug efflux system membrane fusion protein
MTLITVNQIKPIEVFFNVPQADMNLVRRRMAEEKLQVRVALPDEPNLPETGELFFVDNAVDGNTGTIRLGARFTNDDERLWPGQYVLVELRLTTIRDAVVVDSKAISAGREGKYVFVVKADKTVQFRPVRAGVQVGGLTRIEKGLEPGETVVTDGQLRLIDGATVLIQSEKPSASTTPAATEPTSAAATKPVIAEAKP